MLPRLYSYPASLSLGLESPAFALGKAVNNFICSAHSARCNRNNVRVAHSNVSSMSAKDKANTMHSYWVPGVNNLGKFGRWAFAEFTEVFEIEAKFNELIASFVAEKAA